MRSPPWRCPWLHGQRQVEGWGKPRQQHAAPGQVEGHLPRGAATSSGAPARAVLPPPHPAQRPATPCEALPGPAAGAGSEEQKDGTTRPWQGGQA